MGRQTSRIANAKVKSIQFGETPINTYRGADLKRVAKVTINAVDTAGGAFAFVNPEPGPILVNRVTLDVTTAATGAGTIEVGAAANGTTTAANLIDTLDVHTAAGVFDNLANGGTNGKMLQRVAAGAYVTGSTASGTLAGLVGSAYIEYHVL